MTFTPTTNNKISTVNSTTTTLGVDGVYVGTSEVVSKYNSISITVKSNVDSASLGLSFEFSADDTTWDIINSFTYLSENPFITKSAVVKGKYFRVRYVNGGTGQTSFSLQTKFIVGAGGNVRDEKKEERQDFLIDSFNRLRTSKPRTLLANSSILGKDLYSVYENLTGSGTSTHNANSALIEMSVSGTGTVIRRSRRRGIYQPGKSLLVYMTGVLNAGGSNASGVTSKIGYYDDENGYYFQYNNGVVSVIERSSVTGSLVETNVAQSAWNVNSVDGKNGTILFDASKAQIFWFSFEWLGVGEVLCGIFVDNQPITLHKFRHSNILDTPYITMASLPPTYELIGTSGNGTMYAICFTVISEGGYNPVGRGFSANKGTSTENVNTIEPVLSIRLKSGQKINAIVNGVSVMSTSGANFLVELWRFVDNTGALNNPSWISANSESGVEYDENSNNLNTTGGLLLYSAYSSNNIDGIQINEVPNGVLSISNGISDLFVIAITTVGGNENYSVSINWREFI
jgi:hypothetical protein